MPDTPNFAITYPCEGSTISCDDFAVFANDVEAAFVTVDAEATAVTHLPYALQVTSTTPAVGVATTLVSTASAFNFSSGITVAANAFTAVTPGLYLVTAQTQSVTSTLTMTSGRVSILKNAVLVNAIKRKPVIGLPSVSNMTVSSPLDLLAGDAVTFQYLWTGTGALTGPLAASVSIQLLSTP
jgi:hypothetical protein